jgi:hypothetical protein
MMRRYAIEHGKDAALDHFIGADGSGHEYSYDTVLTYTRGAERKSR